MAVDNLQIWAYDLIKTAITNLAGSPLEFVYSLDFNELTKGEKPRIAVEITGYSSEDLFKNNVKRRTDFTLNYEMLVGFKVKDGNDSDNLFKKQMYLIPNYINKALITIPFNVRETDSVTGQVLEFHAISTPNCNNTIDLDKKAGWVFASGTIEILQL